MASRHEIEMDFRAAMNQADKIDGIANRLKNLSNNDYRNTIQNISNAWKGDNADVYVKKSSTLIDKMNGTASKLADAADTIRRIAKNIYDAEMAAWEIAHRREY